MSKSYRSRIPEIVARAERLAPLIVAKTAVDIEAGAKQRTPPRIKTGAMQGGWEAHELDDLEWEVGTTIDYAPYNEYGTRHMAAHPMLVPAAEAERVPFERSMKRLYS